MNMVLKIKSATFYPNLQHFTQNAVFKFVQNLIQGSNLQPTDCMLAYALYRKIINFDQIKFINKTSVSLYFKRNYVTQ